MTTAQFVLVTPQQTVVTLESETARLRHATLDQSSLNFRLNQPATADAELPPASLFDVCGEPCLLERVGGAGWSLKQGTGYASVEPDGRIGWSQAAVAADAMFQLVPAATALLLSPLAGPGDLPVQPEADGRQRLLMIVPWLAVGGADKVNLDLVEGLASSFDITLVTSVASGPWTSRFEPHVTRLIHLSQLLAPQHYAEALARLVERLGIERVLLSNTREGYAATELLRRRFPDLPIYDLLHGQGGDREGGGYPAISAPYDRFLSGRIVITDYLRDLMVGTHGIDGARITRIHNGVDVDQFRPAPQAFEPGALPPVATFIGRLSYEKHPEHVLAIAQALPRAVPCRFKIAGHGPMMAELGQILASDPVVHPVAMLGHVEDVRSLLAETCVLLLTSEMEGFPIVVLEAMAMGVPVICPAVGGIPELVRDGQDGVLVPYGRDFVVEAARALERLLGDEERRIAMGRSARARVESAFSTATMMARYRALLASPPQGQRPKTGLPAAAVIERNIAGSFYVQKLKVRDVAHRLPYFKALCANRTVLHVGCTDFPVFDPDRNLHIHLKDACAALDGLDTDVAGMAHLSRYVPGRYFAATSEIDGCYDLVLVPETIEHVHNIREFLTDLDRVAFREILVTAPCLIGWQDCFSYADRPGRLSSLLHEPDDYYEEVHPDHKAWFTPYTLANCIEQFTPWRISEVLFLEGKRMTAVHCFK